jgi:YHS domain-containing protein
MNIRYQRIEKVGRAPSPCEECKREEDGGGMSMERHGDDVRRSSCAPQPGECRPSFSMGCHLPIPALALSLLAVTGCLLGGRYATPVDRSHEPKHLVNRDRDGLALQGHDAVAYFTDDKPVMGDPSFRTKYEGATYQFASEAHLRMFRENPQAYAPAFGGWCGYAVSIDRLSPIDPALFQILDGRLVLQHNDRAWKLWNEDLAGNLAKADANWPGLVTRNAQADRVLVNVDEQGLALEGRDPLTYFQDGKPRKGEPAHTATYDGAIYRFVSQENRVAFERDPARFAPAFGGFCGYAASIDKISPVNVEIFQILNGRLVLQHTDEAYRRFNADAAGNLAKADRNWPGLVERKGS